MDLSPTVLEVNHVEMPDVEWSVVYEEILGGQGRATVTVQDRANTWEPQTHWDVKAYLRSTGQVFFRGEIIREPVELKVGEPFRRWKLDCADYSNEFAQRLVGAFDGKTWQDVDGLGDYVNIDPFAHTLATDRLSIQYWFDHYIRVDGEAIDTDEFVGEYLTDFGPMFFEYSTLQRAMEEMAAFIAGNLQFWLDPDLKLHWILVPAWQELAQLAAAAIADPSLQPLALGMAQVVVHRLETAAIEITDDNPDYVTSVGGRELSFEYDGTRQPEQLYVQGATGYVYNAPAVNPTGETITINPEGYGTSSQDKFRLTFQATTKIWQKQANGLISSSFDTIGAGGPYEVVFVKVPFNPANGKGGHFWKMTTGPKVGWLVDNDTNYFGYGQILVQKYVVEVIPPKVGIGGSGFVGEVTQDPNKRQGYLRMEISDSRAARDSFGGQALYRGSFPTLRGSITVDNIRRPDMEPDDDLDIGYRVGKLLKITDDRLPSQLNGKHFILQRVKTTLLSQTNVRVYELDWGDGPSSRWSMQQKPGDEEVAWPPPATKVKIDAFDLSPGPNSSQIIYGQLIAKDGTPWQIGGKVVKWALEARTQQGAIVPNMGTLTPLASATDKHGRARTTLKTGSQSGLVYFVFADVAAV